MIVRRVMRYINIVKISENNYGGYKYGKRFISYITRFKNRY